MSLKVLFQVPEASEETFHLSAAPESSCLFLIFFECMVQVSNTGSMTGYWCHHEQITKQCAVEELHFQKFLYHYMLVDVNCFTCSCTRLCYHLVLDVAEMTNASY